MIKKSILFLCMVSQIISFGLSAAAEIRNEPPEDLLPAANKILKNRFQSESWKKEAFPPYFHPDDDFMDFKLGQPITYYKIHLDKLYNLEDKSKFKETLEFLGWLIPIYLGDENKPRTVFCIKKGNGHKWKYASMGGYTTAIDQARNIWPIQEGYDHAKAIVSRMKVPLIILEKNTKIQFYYPGENGERIFGISKNNEGYYPLFSLEDLIRVASNNPQYR